MKHTIPIVMKKISYLSLIIASLLGKAGFAYGQTTQSHLEEHMTAGVLIALMAVVIVVAIIVNVVVCIFLSGCLKKLPQEYQKMTPGLVWLLLIPVFSLVWNFFVVLKLSASFRSYFAAKGKTDVGDCGKMLGLAYAIIAALSFLFSTAGGMGNWLGLAGLILLVLYLIKVMNLKKLVVD